MSEPFLGEIKMFAGNFSPVDWAACDGACLPVQEHVALASLIFDQFGSSGDKYFALPDFQGRVPVHPDDASTPFYKQGIQGGQESVTLTTLEMPAHRHAVGVTKENGTAFAPLDSIPAKAIDGVTGDPDPFWALPIYLVEMNANILAPVGAYEPHPNIQPSAVLFFCIALSGLYPPKV